MGKVLRGQGTPSQWDVITDLSRSRWDSVYTVKHPDHNRLTADEKQAIWAMPEALPKALFANLLTRRGGLQHCHRGDHEERMAWLRNRSWGLGLNESTGHRGILGFMKTLEKWLAEWPTLITLAKKNPEESVRIFSRRQSPYMDSHVGIVVGTGGMPKNAYSSITILPQMRDADLSYFRQLHAKLKPLTDLLSQTNNAATSAGNHEAHIKQLKHYAEQVQTLSRQRDEMVRVDQEVFKWLDSRPDTIPEGRLGIRTRTVAHMETTFYQLLGRQPFEKQYAKAKQYQDMYMKRVEEYTPDITANMIDREAVMKAITQVMEDAVKWATTHDADFTPTDGGEEE